jgi:hypothetical protein
MSGWIFIMLSVPATDTRAVPVPSFDLSNLVQRSDLVVVGRLKSTRPTGKAGQSVDGRQITVQQYAGDLEIEAVYKGNLTGGNRLSIAYALPEVPFETGYREPQKTAARLYFLKSVTSNLVEFTSLYYPDFPVLGSRPKLAEQASTRAAIEGELLQNIERGDDNLAQESLQALWPSTNALNVCKAKLTKGAPLDLRGALLAYSLRAGDIDSIGPAIDAMKEAQRSAPHVLGSIARNIPSLSSKLSVEQLRSLLAIQDASVQSAVARAIRDSGRAELAPVAIDLLDTTKDKQAQYDLIVFLSRLRNIAGPGWGEFMSDPQRFVSEFSHWWAGEGNAEFGSRH